MSDDTLYGNSGNNDLHGYAGDDLLYGRLGDDELYGDSGSDTLFGDNKFGGFGDDHLFGGSENDSLNGGGGNDYLDGVNFWGLGNGIGAGNEFDSLTGGLGDDKFVLGNVNDVYYLGTGHATMMDFNLGQDVIQIKGTFAAGYSLQNGDWNGNGIQDTGILYNNNLIGVVRDENLIGVNPNQVFFSAPSPPG
ncbi:MAG: calcium-binding protein [Microcoleus sp.]